MPESLAVDDHSARFLPQILALCDRVAKLVEQARLRERSPLVLGGDHSVALGSLAGMAAAHGPGGVVWVDAHGDLNTPETSPSGNVHGMVLAAALDLAGDAFHYDDWTLPAIEPGKLALVGVRSLDQGERELLKRLEAKVFTMSEIDKRGVDVCMREAIEHAGGGAFLHLSFDMESSIRSTRRVSEHPFAAASRIARRISRWRRSRNRRRRLARRRRGEPGARPRERDRQARGRARRVSARCADPLRKRSTASATSSKRPTSPCACPARRASRRGGVGGELLLAHEPVRRRVNEQRRACSVSGGGGGGELEVDRADRRLVRPPAQAPVRERVAVLRGIESTSSRGGESSRRSA